MSSVQITRKQYPADFRHLLLLFVWAHGAGKNIYNIHVHLSLQTKQIQESLQ